MKYTFQFHTGDKQVLETRSRESQRHIILKVLGYILYHDRRPRIEIRVSEDRGAYRPDVVAFDASGEIALWVDCGQIAVRKVDDLTKRLPDAEIVIIKVSVHEMEGYAREAAKKVSRVERVRFLGFDPAFVPALIEQMGHINTVRWRVAGDHLTVTFNEVDVSTTLWTWDAKTGSSVVCQVQSSPQSNCSQ